MKIFNYFRRKKVENIVETVNKRNTPKRYLMLVVGCFILALTFNVFFLRYNIVCFGVSGLSIVLSKFGLNPSTFILLANLLLMIINYIVLGKESTKNQFVGAIIYPLFVEITSLFSSYIDLGNIEIIVVVILGGILAGIGSGLIYKSNFSTGGTDVIIEIICKYLKFSMGTAGLIVNTIIITLGKIVFSWDTVLYAILVSYLMSVFTDKVLLGISKSKAFYIVTNKEKDDLIRDFLLSVSGVGVTVIDVEGGYSSDDQTLLLAVVPTRAYFTIKDGLKEIDNNVFFLVCDSYEVSNDKGDYLCY